MDWSALVAARVLRVRAEAGANVPRWKRGLAARCRLTHRKEKSWPTDR